MDTSGVDPEEGTMSALVKGGRSDGRFLKRARFGEQLTAAAFATA